ncbi:MAG: UPF0182 family protein [Anaerolineales bacterium]|nr:UPF0182 family protein [Anaerolineales bacterium]
MSWWHRLLFAIRFADINLLLSSDIQPDSQLLWRRNITERVQEIAPFLQLDSDPYIAVGDDGKLYWYLDAYVMDGRFPYSEPFRNQFNYIRNSVKIIVDAYTGQTTFYVVDEEEPITATYRRIFPSLFKPISELPVFLAGAHPVSDGFILGAG